MSTGASVTGCWPTPRATRSPSARVPFASSSSRITGAPAPSTTGSASSRSRANWWSSFSRAWYEHAVSLTYELLTHSPSGRERLDQYASEEPLTPGEVLQLRGRFWLVESVDEPAGESGLPRAIAKPARYRIRLRHPDDREELGAFRRFRPGSPRLGHALTTIESGQPISWQVIDEQLAHDDDGEPYLDLRAERDYAEAEGDVPDHELEHALERQLDEGLPSAAAAAIARAAEQGLDLELVALDPGEEPDWPESRRDIDALILAENDGHLFEHCRVDADHRTRGN